MALSADIKIARYGVPGNATQNLGQGFQFGGSVTVYGGSIALTDSTGLVKNAASPSSTDTCWGLVHAQTTNASTATSSGLVLDVNGRPFEIETGTFWLASAGSGDALDQTCLGKVVYVYDEQTVAKGSNGNTRPVAGVLRAIDPTMQGGFAVKLGSNQSSGA